MASYAAAPVISRDKKGDNHLHLAYTVFEPPLNFFLWYAYYDEGGWSISSSTLDAQHNALLPSMVADSKGNIYIIYSWYETELDRTLMYIKGTPEKPQG
ncbi:hypothetical protein ES703_56401 [subsurface metagenome]